MNPDLATSAGSGFYRAPLSGSGNQRLSSAKMGTSRLNLLLLGAGAVAFFYMYRNAQAHQERHSKEHPGSYEHQFALRTHH